MEDSQKNRIGGSFFGCLERLLSPMCHKRLPTWRMEVAPRNEIVYKLRSFVDFRVPLSYNFGLCTLPVSVAQIVANGGKMGGIEERWDDPSKPAEFLGSAEEWYHVSSGRREREARPSLLHSLSRGVQRILPRLSIQPIITFIFSPNFVGLETQAM